MSDTLYNKNPIDVDGDRGCASSRIVREESVYLYLWGFVSWILSLGS